MDSALGSSREAFRQEPYLGVVLRAESIVFGVRYPKLETQLHLSASLVTLGKPLTFFEYQLSLVSVLESFYELIYEPDPAHCL